MANPSRYRYISFTGGEILQAREMIELQRIQEGLDQGGDTRVAFDLDMIYREGAMFNITPTLNAGVVTFGPTNTALPMYIFVRGQWEILQPSEVGTLTISSSGGSIFLNWQLRIVTSLEDTTLVDTSTDQPTADMGELDLSVSITDTSGVALSSSQFEKNTATIILFTYNSSDVLVPIDNVNPLAYGTLSYSGLVSLSTSTANGVACSTNDPRLSNGRTPTAGTVIDASVRIPVSPGGNNTDGTPIYNLTSDVGGINAAKIIYVAGTQLVSDAIGFIKSQISSIFSTLTSHIGVQLGSSATHPMPTATQVGAAPIGHIGLNLGITSPIASHPPVVTWNESGYQLNRDDSVVPIAGDAAYGIFGSTSGLITGLLHNGDITVNVAAPNVVGTQNLPPGVSTPLITGSLSSYLRMAIIVGQHVNQVSHCNPHGLAATDLGFSFGTNGNGSFLLFPSTLGSLKVCWGQITMPANPGQNETGPENITFPITYSSVPRIQATVTGLAEVSGGNNDTSVINLANTTISGSTVFAMSPAKTDGGGLTFENSFTVDFFAIGV